MKNAPLYLLMFLAQIIFSQDYGSVRGTILDQELNNDPLLFAHISLKNTDISTQSNFHGNFELTGIIPGHYTLVVSYLGYESLELPIRVEKNETTMIQEGLQAMSISMNEITLKGNDQEMQYSRETASSAPGIL